MSNAFFASPFRAQYAWLREAVREACQVQNVELRAVDETTVPGEDLVRNIYVEIKKATFGIVVLSDLNPNVMYELGLLHQAGKPTILLADQESMVRLPFDIRTRLVIRYDAETQDKFVVRRAVVAAIGSVQRLLDPVTRGNIASGVPELSPGFTHKAASLEFHEVDFEAIKERAAKGANKKACVTTNISSYDSDDIKGWQIKAKCRGGDTMRVIVDIDGNVREVDIT